MNYNGKSKKYKLYGVLTLFILLIAYFTYFNDYFKYLEVKNIRSEYLCKEYYNDYPDGYFTEEVKVIEIEITKDINLIRHFINNYPKSEHYSVVKIINENLWDLEITRYDSIVNSNSEYDPAAINFFRNLLYYMRDENIEKIGVNLNGSINVKDFDEYDFELKELYDEYYEIEDGRNVSDNIVELKKHYQQGDIDSYEEIICNSIETSFENILSENFIKVTTDKSESSLLKIDINYSIDNEESNNEPGIWIYTVNNMFSSYVLGVSINFKFNIDIPETNLNYSFIHEANALDNINNIKSLEDGYSKMTEQNFQNFATIISSKFGISKKINICDCNDVLNEMINKVEEGQDKELIEKEYYFQISDCQSFWSLPDEEYQVQINECQ